MGFVGFSLCCWRGDVVMSLLGGVMSGVVVLGFVVVFCLRRNM